MPLLSTLGAGKWGGSVIQGLFRSITLNANNFGSTGYLGPTQSQVDNSNPGYPVSVFSTGYIEFTIPRGTYDFDIGGASGGAIPDGTLNKPTTNTNFIDGRGRLCGARILSRYTFSDPVTLLCVVGQGGQDDSATTGNPSGGGGTFIALSSYSSIATALPFLVAGGAGGLGGDNAAANLNNTAAGIGQSTNAGGNSNQTANSDGTNPDWDDTNVTNSSGGASFYTNTDGASLLTGFVRDGTQANLLGFGFRTGALGDRDAAFLQGAGGYGGGGRTSSQTTSDDDKGGGGGYSGGSFGYDAQSAGGGGGSFVATGGSNIVVTAGGNNNRHGYINITKI